MLAEIISGVSFLMGVGLITCAERELCLVMSVLVSWVFVPLTDLSEGPGTTVGSDTIVVPVWGPYYYANTYRTTDPGSQGDTTEVQTFTLLRGNVKPVESFHNSFHRVLPYTIVVTQSIHHTKFIVDCY